MKIAVLQNKIGIDGRSVVVAEMVRICNKHGVRPDVFTFTKPPGLARFKNEYGRQDLKYEVASLSALPLARGTAYQTPLLNIMASRALHAYDVVLNSGRCPYFLPPGPRFIHYIHFPVETSLIEEEHFKSALGAIYTLPLKLLYFRRAERIYNGTFVTNSLYTLSRARKLYTAVPDAQIHVIYPPCDIHTPIMDNVRDIDVISLGAFISDKRQLEQLKIAKKLPSRKFVLVGGVKSRKYFEKCQKFVQSNGLQNIELVTDVSKKEVKKLLNHAKVFLHTKRGEHFGISTVEAISSGCIPVVHDSGGLRETVPLEKLRFESVEDACFRIESILKQYNEYQHAIITPLLENVKRFSRERFSQKMATLIFGKLA
jgi:glycosyltransferase involved in cell wall biosynthesis